MKKFIGLLLSVLLMVTASIGFSGCNRQQQQTFDSSKTQLYVANYEGGHGNEWLNSIKTKFEDMYADQSFEEGKMGVEVVTLTSKEYEVGKISSTLNNLSNVDVIFTTSASMYQSMVSGGQLLDITDAVTEKLTEHNENKSIEDKMSESFKNWFKVDGKYYGMPFFIGDYSIQYDVDLWEREDAYLYFSKSGDNETGTNNTFVESLDEERGMGPDGKYGTYDDGLPSTFDEFYNLCDKMVDLGYKALVWNNLSAYLTNFLISLSVDVAGIDNITAKNNLNGQITDPIVDFEDGKPIIGDPLTISMENGYEAFKSSSMYYPLAFLEKIISEQGNWIDSRDCIDGGLTYLEAQSKFVTSSPSSDIVDIGMLFEGPWWYNECSGARKDLSIYGEDQSNRRWGNMPFPKATAAHRMTDREDGISNTTINANVALCGIKKNISSNKEQLAKDFLRFFATDVQLSEFTKITSLRAGYNYTVSESDLKDCSYYAKSLDDRYSNAELYNLFTPNAVVKNNMAMYCTDAGYWEGNGGLIHPFVELKKTNAISAEEYFNKIVEKRNATSWEAIIGA